MRRSRLKIFLLYFAPQFSVYTKFGIDPAAVTIAFLTIAFDPSYTGESGGTPRYVASPDINTEDFCAAVDFLSVQENVDPERIGIIGICGWGGMAINAAAIDTRVKATAANLAA